MLRVTVTIHNRGEIVLRVGEGFLRVQQILPCAPDMLDKLVAVRGPSYPEFEWPEIKTENHSELRAEIEPGECEPIRFDFVLNGAVAKVSLYGYFKNPAKQNMGWATKSTVDLRTGGFAMLETPEHQPVPRPLPPMPAPEPEPLRQPSEPVRKEPFQRPPQPPPHTPQPVVPPPPPPPDAE